MISFNKKQQSAQHGGMILDTCALIDGRILDIAKAGFVPHNLVIPQFVIAELQYLADNGDSHKRERARFGLDVIRDLQEMRRVNVFIAREQFSGIKEVDDKLIALAKQYGAMLYTTDYNLNKVAQIEGVHVLNVNELAQALRPHRLPGERLELKITQVGQDKTQGVGYLDDGTMVVVEKAGNKVGQKVIVEFSRILQTQAGKMMFAVLPERQQTNQPKLQPEQKQAQQAIPRIAPQQKAQPQQQQMSRRPQSNAQQQLPSQRPLRAWHSPRPSRTHRPQQSQSQQQQRRPSKSSPDDALLQALQRTEGR